MLDRVHLEHWADTFTAQSDFPELIRRLIYASTPFLSKVDIPYGSAVNMGGLDGDLELSQATSFLPQGRIILEFGTNANFKSKADNDYSKRTKDPITGLDKSKTTFIFMTPHCWGNKKDWEDEKEKDNVWKEVRVYDSVFLAQWITSVPSVEIWFASKVGFPVNDMVLGSERLEELLTGPIILGPQFYTCGREAQAEDLRRMLKTPTLRAFRASSKEDALGFILSAASLFPEQEKESFYAKTIVVENKAAFRQMRSQTAMINLVPEFDEQSVLYKAVSDGKVVLVPLGPGDEFNQEVIDLPAPDRFGLEEVLKQAGVDEEKAKRIIKDSSCNLTMIKKSLDFPSHRVDWLNDESVTDILPALVVERWNENYQGDKDILEILSSKGYEEFKQSMILWSQKSVPPVMSVGALWRLTSPLSLWADMSSKVQAKTIEQLQGIAVRVLTDEGKKYSYQLKEGILNSLIILAWHGESLFGNSHIGQAWVDEIIKTAIHNADIKRWNALAKHLPLIAEASPSVFIEEVKESLSSDEATILALFNEEDGLFAPESNYPHLLWALESLAWLPINLKSVSVILLLLSEKDPGGKLSNRPFNSLVDIYLPWLPHTTASFDDRMMILEELASMNCSKMWDFLVALLPRRNAVTSGTHKLKWRGYDLSAPKGTNQREWWLSTEKVCDLLMTTFDDSDHHLADLIERIEPIPYPIRKKVIEWIGEVVAKLGGNIPETRKALRETLWLQNNLKQDNDGRFMDSEIEVIKKAYKEATALDVVEKHRWLFDEFAPRLPEEDEDDKDMFAGARERERQRKSALAEWVQELPLDKIVSLGSEVGEPYEYGRTLATFHSKEGLNDAIFNLLEEEEERKFTYGYINGLEREIGEEGMLCLVVEDTLLKEQQKKILFLLGLYGTRNVYDYVETLPEDSQNNYWRGFPSASCGHQGDETLYVIKKLVSVGRSLDALTGSWYIAKELPTDVLQLLLKETLNVKLEANGPMDYLALETDLEELHKRVDADKELLMALEWMYTPLLRSHPSKEIIQLLYKKLADEPQFFVELLTYLYKPEHDEGNASEKTMTEEEQLRGKNNALRAYYLLREWQLIPGVDDKGVVDKSKLKQWIDEAIRLASEQDRLKFAYLEIGTLLSKYPEGSDYWPSMDLFSVMESLNNEVLFQNYNIGMFNKRGFTSRGGYEGGDIERNNATYFEGLSEKCQPLYPNVSKVFKNLSEQYTRMAKEMDDEATIAKLDY